MIDRTYGELLTAHTAHLVTQSSENWRTLFFTTPQSVRQAMALVAAVHDLVCGRMRHAN